MTNTLQAPEAETKAPVLIPFVCPICAGANAVNLISLSRAGGVACEACKKRLRHTDVMRAMHAPRGDAGEPQRKRAPPEAKPAMVWPPTPESRAAIKPLYNRERK